MINCDVDLAGEAPAQFIIGSIESGSKARFGPTYGVNMGYENPPMMQYVIDTTQALKDSGAFIYDTTFHGTPLYRTYSQAELNNGVNGMIKHFQEESKEMLDKPAFDADSITNFNQDKATIDLDSDAYENATVYININDDSRILNFISGADQLILKKRPSTVVVFNVQATGTVHLNQYLVETDGKTVKTTTTCEGDDSDGNKDTDKYIAIRRV